MGELGGDLASLNGKDVRLKNGMPLYYVLGRLVVDVAIGPVKAAPVPAVGCSVTTRLAS